METSIPNIECHTPQNGDLSVFLIPPTFGAFFCIISSFWKPAGDIGRKHVVSDSLYFAGNML